MRVFVVIPVHNRLEYTRVCLTSLREQRHRGFQAVVVDDGSTDGTYAALAREHPDVAVLWGDGDLWWAGAMNVGLEWVLARANPHDYVLTLNNDTAIPPDCLERLLGTAVQRARALVGCVAVSWSDHERIVDGGTLLDWRTAHARTPCKGLRWSQANAQVEGAIQVSVLSGRATLIPSGVFRRLGLYDSRHLPHYGADWEFSRRAQRAGYELLIDYRARVFSREEETGLRPGSQTLSVRDFLHAYADIRSPNNLRYRWNFARLCADPHALPLFAGMDLLKTIGGGVKRQTLGRKQSDREDDGGTA